MAEITREDGSRITELVVDESRWNGKRLTLGHKEDSCLLSDKKGDMCCFGFVALECGHNEGVILGVAYMRDLRIAGWGANISGDRLRSADEVLDLLSETQREAVAENSRLSPSFGNNSGELWVTLIQDSAVPYHHKKNILKRLFKAFFGVKLTFTGTPPEVGG